MPQFRCNSCNATYPDPRPDGSPAFHVCPADQITHAVCDAQGNVLTPEKRVPWPNARNENIKPGSMFYDGKPGRMVPLPDEPARSRFVEGPIEIVSEGLGRTQIG